MGRKKRTRRPLTAQDLANIYYWKYGLGKSTKQIAVASNRTKAAVIAVLRYVNHSAMTYGNPARKEVVSFGDIAGEPFPYVVAKKKEQPPKQEQLENLCEAHQWTDVQGLILHLTEANIDRSLKLRLIGELL
jgi:hypothetical protein